MDLLPTRGRRETGPRENPRHARVCSGDCGERQAADLGRLDAPMVAGGRLDRVSGRGWHRSDFAGWQIHAQPDFTQVPSLRVLEDGTQFYGVFQNTTGNGAQWQLYSVNVKTGAEKFLAPIDLSASVDRMAGFSIHPDGKRFLTSVAKFPFDIWMLEGFEQPEPKSFLDRLLRR